MSTAEHTPHLTRQLDLIPLECLDQAIHIIGCGAIGSFTALALAKMGYTNLDVWDDDTIEIENMNCQFYRHSDVGRLKAEALHDLLADFTDADIGVHTERYEGVAPLPGIVISAVDSMAARQMIWDAHTTRGLATQLVIDPRMGAETALCYAMRPMVQADQTSYAATLYTDAAAVHERCTAKATMYTACMLSGFVAKVVKDFTVTKGSRYPRNMQWSIAENALQVWTC